MIKEVINNIKVPKGYKIKKINYREYESLGEYDLNVIFEKEVKS